MVNNPETVSDMHTPLKATGIGHPRGLSNPGIANAKNKATTAKSVAILSFQLTGFHPQSGSRRE